ncbi:MAG: hypothetical protein ACTSVI_12205 [Promethearchaeota archaeon]
MSNPRKSRKFILLATLYCTSFMFMSFMSADFAISEHNNMFYPSDKISKNEEISLNSVINGTLNETVTMLNYTLNLTIFNIQNRLSIELAVPGNCDFDLYLDDRHGIMVASSDARVTGVMNESIFYTVRNTGIFYILVQRFSGNGTFNLTASEVLNTGAPELSSYGVSLNNTHIFNTYEFFTMYRDADGFSPIEVNLILDNVVYPMTFDPANGTNYTLGVKYHLVFSKLEAGIHDFQFNASDGVPMMSPTPLMHVNVSKPASLLVSQGNPREESFNAGFNNSNGWENSSSDASSPWILFSSTYHSSPSCVGIDGSGTPLINPSNEGYFYTPLYELGDNYKFRISFGYRLNFAAASIDIQENFSSWTNLAYLTNALDQWTRVEINLTSHAGSYVRFRFHFIGYYGSYLCVDDLNVSVRRDLPMLFPIQDESLSPNHGNQYTIFHLDLTYFNNYANYPETLDLVIYNGSFAVQNEVYRYSLIESDTMDWNVIDGKAYYCEFQLVNVTTPVLMIELDYGYILPYYKDVSHLLLDNSESLENTSMPLYIGFEGQETYYFIDSTGRDRVGVVSDGNNHYFSTGTIVDPADPLMDLGLVTPIVNLSSRINVFLSFYMELTYNSININDDFSISASIDGGISWEIITRYNETKSGLFSLNVSKYVNKSVAFRFLLSTSYLNILNGSQWNLDNISVHEVDLTKPIITLINIKDGKVINGIFNLIINVSDVGFGFDQAIIKIDGEMITSTENMAGEHIELNFNTNMYSKGEHVITVIVIDKAGNQNIYTFSVQIDNTPYWLYILIIAMIAATIILLISRFKLQHARNSKNLVARGKIGKNKKKLFMDQDIVREIRSITSIFRKISFANLAARIKPEGMTPRLLHDYLEQMLDDGVIKGEIVGNTFIRYITPEQHKTMPKMNETKIPDEMKNIIINFVKTRKKTSTRELLKELGLSNDHENLVEEIVGDLIREKNLSWYFDGDFLINEQPEHKDDASKNEQEQGPEKQQQEKTTMSKGIASKAIRSSRTLESVKDELINLVNNRKKISFDEILKNLTLNPDIKDDLEDFAVELITNEKLSWHVEGDYLINDELEN